MIWIAFATLFDIRRSLSLHASVNILKTGRTYVFDRRATLVADNICQMCMLQQHHQKQNKNTQKADMK